MSEARDAAAAADLAAAPAPEAEDEPFDLAPGVPGEGVLVDAAVLCVHGLTGTPYEVRAIGEAMAARGVRARGPLLPGHGDTPEALAQLEYNAWVECVRDEYRRLRSEHERVFVTGLSLGGLLSLVLAAEEGVAATAVVGTPLRFRATLRVGIALGRLLRITLRKRSGSDIADPEARLRHPGYPVMPLAAVHQLVKLQKQVGAMLESVRGPLLVAHGRLDRTADPRDLERIAQSVRSAEVETLVLDRSGHVVPVDYDAVALCDAIAAFFSRVR